MAASRKMIDFKGREKRIQTFANQYCDGNFTEALITLVDMAFHKMERQEEDKKK